MKKYLAILFVTLSASLAFAGDGDFLVRGRLINVAPNDDSSDILTTGTHVTVDDAFVPEVDLTYFFNKNWGLEIIAATSPHDISTESGALGGADAGEVWVLPPTLTLQYHFGKDKAVDVYAGLGINYSLFYNYDISDDLKGLGVSDIDFDSSFGLAGNLGVDFKLTEKWVFNLDLKYIDIATDADLELEAGGILDTLDVDIDPLVVGIGVGYRF
ncbi:OmpW family protein [Sulfidibacter corallicola]|uniref:OmpW family protein n=1 Tax=Sulfidibacter corallicola TaxID=2818388 RepID=A0A8A4TFH9_SULCO|nr:OmpW family outer membrane protein [Sulfidibacter corallicola]QTD48310.1 OmpW family protein [Sulfidibacter corallicola]